MTPSATAEVAGEVMVDYHQFYFAAIRSEVPDLEPDDFPAFPRMLSRVTNGFVVVQTGIRFGPTSVRVRVLTGPSADQTDAGWEDVEEVLIETSTSGLGVLALGFNIGPELAEIAVPDGAYRLRVHARGRHQDYDGLAKVPTEFYLFDVWPDD